MNDLEIAKKNLAGHSICVCKDGTYMIHDGRGISPMMEWIAQGRNLAGYSVADVIVGKAAALLFVKTGIAAVYGKTMSQSAAEFLERHGISYSYETLTERIINRLGTDICPMEKTVADIDDVESGYQALREKIQKMRG